MQHEDMQKQSDLLYVDNGQLGSGTFYRLFTSNGMLINIGESFGSGWDWVLIAEAILYYNRVMQLLITQFFWFHTSKCLIKLVYRTHFC